jgi:uncharacterized membrane protein YvbJ
LEEKAMRCNNCGTENQNGSKFCRGCGAVMNGMKAAPQFNVQAQADRAGSGSKGIKHLIIFLIGAVMVAGGVVLMLKPDLFTKVSDNSNVGGTMNMISLALLIVGGLFVVDSIFSLFRKKK